ncbi:hypothetical protein FACS189444_0550 [Spirochaetia bacterium]|uniref:c-type cytochrome n=1 Tax=Hydrotalea TaxID=1004300 RepID=UPI0009423C92|nr:MULTISPECIES: cytochrome c [Hydrotalea]RWZ85818.1 MAG: cytochrome c [Hydrotalea sp. AMD]GHU57830.1 hypothetical protein FACS189444_0550 [Spirochaetia bacterium]
MKNKIIFFLALLLSSLLFFESCTKQSEDQLLSPSTLSCDTINVQYSTTIVAILNANCYRCHGAVTNGGSGGIILEGYFNLKKWADNGYLVGNITHAPGYVPMPYDGGKLSDCDINKIKAWINQGTKNN